ncbi:MAG TPA: DNA-3-methyladenine glycosylase, partial [Ignavibacteria bacterium]|nr:DNA-3-methyladenine glycosylase [Ignavibacteria bacterium]
FEAISWAIIGQQINLSFAFKMKRNFVEKFGEKFSFENKTYFLYPKPEIVSKLKVSDLLKLQFSRQKAEYVIEAAKTLTDFEISEAYKKNLTGLPLIEAKEILCKIRGVGNWTANYALMKCLRNPDAFPIEDVGLHNAIKNILGLDSKPSVENIRKLSAKWKGWYSYSVFYLWRSLLPD